MISLPKKLGYTNDEFKKFLTREYEVKSQAEIARELNCHLTCIEGWFKRLYIKTRNKSEASGRRWKNKVSLSDKQKSILDGLLLSDLHLEKPYIQSRASFGLKYEEFGESIRRELKELEFNKLYIDKNTGCYHSKSKSCDILTEYYEKWYLDKIKVVPRDLKLTSETLYWWYLGDGRVEDYGIGLCTDSFSRHDVDFLMKKIEELDLECSYYGSSNRIRIKSKSVKRFFEIIGECRHECYDYKWKIRIKRKNNQWIKNEQR